MKRLTEDTLGVYWSIKVEKDNGDVSFYHEETEGVLVYGYWNKEFDLPTFPFQIWSADTQVQNNTLWGDGWFVLEWTVRICTWPLSNTWKQVIQGTLEAMCETGAIVAWCAVEACFADPPSLFSPESMSGGVYAALIPNSQFWCSAKPGLHFQALDDSILLKLKEVITNFQDV